MYKTGVESDGVISDGVISYDNGDDVISVGSEIDADGDGDEIDGGGVGDETVDDQIVSFRLDVLIEAGTDSADEQTRYLGEMATSAKNGNKKALFDIGLIHLRGDSVQKDNILARAFLIVLTKKYPKQYGVAHLELARIYRAEMDFKNAENHFIIADLRDCALAIPELEMMRGSLEYHPPFPLDEKLENECISNARENMHPENFLVAESFLYTAILCGSTKALDLLNRMRADMFQEGYDC